MQLELSIKFFRASKFQSMLIKTFLQRNLINSVMKHSDLLKMRTKI